MKLIKFLNRENIAKRAGIVCVPLALMMVLVFVFECAIMDPTSFIKWQGNRSVVVIEDPSTPLNDGRAKALTKQDIEPALNGSLITQTDADIHIIPDKYNTGCRGELTSVLPGDKVKDVLFVSSGKEIALNFYYKNSKIANKVVIENCDFSSNNLVFTGEGIDHPVEITFRNCKFAEVRNTAFKGGNVTYKFESCSLNKFKGSSSTFRKCYFGSCCSDSFVAFQNILVEDCYFSDIAHEAPEGKVVHMDGVQIYAHKDAAAKNIVFNRCRFETPATKTGVSTAAVNACIMIQLEYNAGEDIHFTNCLINGGGYSIYAHAVKEARSMTLENITLENIKVGGARLYGTLYPDLSPGIRMEKVDDQDSLYVSSVWKDGNGVHIITTNDTTSERILRVVTDKSYTDYVISACRGGRDLRYDTRIVKYEEFPFDIDICIPAESKYVICYDVTDGNEKQIRFVSFNGSSVYRTSISSDDKEVVTEEVTSETVSSTQTEEKENSIDKAFNVSTSLLKSKSSVVESNSNDGTIVEEGKCGKSATYTLASNGVLHIYGSGDITDYHSLNMAPWQKNAGDIVLVVIDEGITHIGNQAFRKLDKIKSIEIPKSVRSIGSNAFSSCSNLQYVSFYSGLSKIGARAFNGTGIVRCDFYGTENEWGAVKIGDYNDKLVNANVVYSKDESKKAEIVKNGSCGNNAYYELNNEGVLRIYGSGAMTNFHSLKNAPWYADAKSISKVIIEEGITSVGNQAFRNEVELTDVQLPDSIEIIGANAFIGCSNLTSIRIGIKVKSIGRYAFNGTNLKNVRYAGDSSSWGKISIGDKNGNLEKNVIFEK